MDGRTLSFRCGIRKIIGVVSLLFAYLFDVVMLFYLKLWMSTVGEIVRPR